MPREPNEQSKGEPARRRTDNLCDKRREHEPHELPAPVEGRERLKERQEAIHSRGASHQEKDRAEEAGL